MIKTNSSLKTLEKVSNQKIDTKSTCLSKNRHDTFYKMLYVILLLVERKDGSLQQISKPKKHLK